MKSIFDEYTGDEGFDFPLPEGEEWPDDYTEEGQRWSAKVSFREWQLDDLRGGKSKDGQAYVINLKATALAHEDDYTANGKEVAYWFRPQHLSNPKHPARGRASMLAKMLVSLGEAKEEDFREAESPEEFLETLVNLAQKASVFGARFSGTLVFEKRSYKGQDDEVRNITSTEFRGIKNVTSAEIPF